FCFGFGGGVLEFLIDQFGHFRCLRRVFDPDGVPAYLAFSKTATSLFKVVVAEEEGSGVGALCLAVINPHNVKVPNPALVLLAPDRGRNRNAVSNFPLKTVCRFSTDNRPGPCLQPGLFLFRREDK